MLLYIKKKTYLNKDFKIINVFLKIDLKNKLRYYKNQKKKKIIN